MKGESVKKIRVWDLPLRLFHWTLAVLVITAILAIKLGDAMELHLVAGSSVLALIAFRIVWGLVGPRYARFSSFLHGPSTIAAYVRGRERKSPGHNPPGSVAVFALLGLLLAQASIGLFSNDDIAFDGPLVKFVSKDLSDRLTWLHAEIGATLIYVLIGSHIAAIAYYYLFRKRNLVTSMITGDQEVDVDAVPASDSWRIRLLAAVVFLVCAAAVYGVVTL
jgi:cytochrome b